MTTIYLGGSTPVQTVNGKTGQAITLNPGDVGAAYTAWWRGSEIPAIGLHADDPTTTIKTCLRRGFTPVWIGEVADAMKGVRGLPPLPVLLILDDGYPQWFTTAHPLLQTYNFKANLAITSEFSYGRSTVDLIAPGVTWSQLRTMVATGLYDVANHTATHAVGPNTFEIDTCHQAILTELGMTARSLVYPHGTWDAATVQRIRQYGYEMGFTFGDDDHPTVLSGAGSAFFHVARTTQPADPLRWARQTVLHDPQMDCTGGPNASNQLGYWTFSGSAALAASGYEVDLTAASASATTSDYFHVPSGIVYSHALLASTGQSAGTAKLNVLQYDYNQNPLSTLTLATISTAQTATSLDIDVNLDANCRFVRLQAITDASYNGTNFQVQRWVARVR